MLLRWKSLLRRKFPEKRTRIPFGNYNSLELTLVIITKSSSLSEILPWKAFVLHGKRAQQVNSATLWKFISPVFLVSSSNICHDVSCTNLWSCPQLWK